jgi:Spy/CpxP family protein refolding chaperone
MKNPKALALLLSLGLLGSGLLHAQDQNPSGEGRRGKGGSAEGGRGAMMSPEARVEQLDKALTLTAEQKTKITAIYTKSAEEMRAAMRDGGGDREAAREKMMAAMQKTRGEVRALLTDEQKKKFDDMPQRGGGDQGGRSGGGGGDGGKRGGKKAN